MLDVLTVVLSRDLYKRHEQNNLPNTYPTHWPPVPMISRNQLTQNTEISSGGNCSYDCNALNALSSHSHKAQKSPFYLTSLAKFNHMMRMSEPRHLTNKILLTIRLVNIKKKTSDLNLLRRPDLNTFTNPSHSPTHCLDSLTMTESVRCR